MKKFITACLLALAANTANAGVIIEKPVKEKFTVYCKASRTSREGDCSQRSGVSEKASITVFATDFRIVNGELILPSGLVCKSWKVEKQ